jgi:N-acylneuraminate cytidylyltransferase
MDSLMMLVMDFDGVHTDGFVYVDQDGKESVRCSRRDGLGLELIKKAGVKLCIISKEKNPVVEARCKKLDIEFYQGVEDSGGKLSILKTLLEREKISPEDVAYIGDDVNDIEALKYVGFPVTVADGHEEVKKIVSIQLSRKGGDHAIRELCDIILSSRSPHVL